MPSDGHNDICLMLRYKVLQVKEDTVEFIKYFDRQRYPFQVSFIAKRHKMVFSVLYDKTISNLTNKSNQYVKNFGKMVLNSLTESADWAKKVLRYLLLPMARQAATTH
jgi:hypothetical protein